MILTYKYRVKDNSAGKRLATYARAANFIWNYCNAQQRDAEARYRAGAPKRKWATHFDYTYLTAGVSKEIGIPSDTIGEICRQYAQSRNRNRGALRFRSSFGKRRALGWVPFRKGTCRIAGNSITYWGKQYRIFGCKRRPIPAAAKGGAFVEDALGRWWVTFYVETEARLSASGTNVGIDLGLRTLATMSDGSKLNNIRPFGTIAAKLATAQRAGNKGRTRAIYAKIANVRKDYLHKITTHLARSNAIIAVGNVNSMQLAKTKMAKSVLDAGWSTFRLMLKYKSPGYVEVDEKFTTQTCSECGSIAGPKGYAGLNKRSWECPDCGASHDRDVNAAKVILLRALSAQGRVDGSRKATRISTNPQATGLPTPPGAG